MIAALQEHRLCCPYCGEGVTMLVDATEIPAVYIEDCAICCRPIRCRVTVGADGAPELTAEREDE